MIHSITHSAMETEELAVTLAAQLRPGDLIACRGGLGAGKTAFARGLARGLGLSDEVSSPTFALVHEYAHGPLPLYHFDMYRVPDMDALDSTGFFDYLDLPGVLLVEWSENIADALPDSAILLTIRRVDDEVRDITIEGERF